MERQAAAELWARAVEGMISFTAPLRRAAIELLEEGAAGGSRGGGGGNGGGEAGGGKGAAGEGAAADGADGAAADSGASARPLRARRSQLSHLLQQEAVLAEVQAQLRAARPAAAAAPPAPPAPPAAAPPGGSALLEALGAAAPPPWWLAAPAGSWADARAKAAEVLALSVDAYVQHYAKFINQAAVEVFQ